MRLQGCQRFRHPGSRKNAKESYGFKPTQEVRSFAQFIGHIADDQYAYCSAAKAKANPRISRKTRRTRAGWQ